MLDIIKIIKKRKQIMGMNSRNLEYIRPYNLKHAKEIADDKILSKKVLRKGELPIPDMISKIPTHEALDNFDWYSLPNSFVLKPNKGFGGEGIIVTYGRRKNQELTWIKADGSSINVDDLKNHIRNILDGSYSLANIPDIAFFEERLQIIKDFKAYSYRGIPDIRVIVFNKVPVMAMLRLPTKASGGKANLKQGAIGVGIDLATGVTTNAILNNVSIEYVPGTRLLLSGIKIPKWRNILKMAVQAQEISGLGFLGADVAIDRNKGPVFLELNARPGLGIQVANLNGLKERLNRVIGLKIKTIEKGVRMGMDLFGGEVEGEVEDISGKKVIGTIEKITLLGKNEQTIEVEAKIDTGAYSSSIDIELAKKLGYDALLETFSQIDLSNYKLVPENERHIKKDILQKYQISMPDLADVAVVFSASGSSIRPVIKTTFKMDEESVSAKINITDRSKLTYPMIVGKRDLKRFLIEIK